MMTSKRTTARRSYRIRAARNERIRNATFICMGVVMGLAVSAVLLVGMIDAANRI
jgi:hypothetical protein